jgi:formimidoylglutamate deiminase
LESIRVLLPQLTYVGDRFVRDVAVAFDASGAITYVGAVAAAPDGQRETLASCALVPGMVNAHSHAFQRAIRGYTQWKPSSAADADFWSWRDAMYRAVLRFTPEDLYDISAYCFLEMLLAGYTTVGEFHYVQRDERGEPYADPNELAHTVVRAAEDVGIRIVLLNVCYARGGVGESLHELQRRFATPDLDEFLRSTDALGARLAGRALASVGIAPHSIRAVPREWLRPIAEHARTRGYRIHMHVSEQPAEVQASIDVYGRPPGELVLEAGLPGPDFTAVHATQLTTGEVIAFGAAGATICVCPTTERDLGDGIPAAQELHQGGARFCIGSDSQTVLDPWEELRGLEYHTRLRTMRRVVLAEEASADRWEVAPVLLRAGTINGAGALGVETGVLQVGARADFVAIDLEHSALAGWTDATLPALLALSAPDSVVRDVWVNGNQVVDNREHEKLRAARARFAAVCGRLLA